jgi:4-oxalocrotonate tautomerase
MPLVQVRLIKGVFTEQQNLRDVTWVTIEEVPSGEWGIGGKAMTAEAVIALASGKAAA